MKLAMSILVVVFSAGAFCSGALFQGALGAQAPSAPAGPPSAAPPSAPSSAAPSPAAAAAPRAQGAPGGSVGQAAPGATANAPRMPAPQIEGKVVASNDDVVFRQIDEHTWIGSGHMMANESMYLVEGNNKAVLIDAGTKVADLDKVVASITKKPIMLVATHAHPDHTGSAINYFPELYMNPGDKNSPFVSQYKGTIKDLKDGETIDLGGRSLIVVFTPGHTPGATTYLDPAAGYGFSGDSFGSGNLLLLGDFSTLLATCEKTSALMEKYNIKLLYPGHFNGKNPETPQRVKDEATISKDVLSGKVKGEPNPRAFLGLNQLVVAYGVRINYAESSVK